MVCHWIIDWSNNHFPIQPLAELHFNSIFASTNFHKTKNKIRKIKVWLQKWFFKLKRKLNLPINFVTKTIQHHTHLLGLDSHCTALLLSPFFMFFHFFHRKITLQCHWNAILIYSSLICLTSTLSIFWNGASEWINIIIIIIIIAVAVVPFVLHLPIRNKSNTFNIHSK